MNGRQIATIALVAVLAFPAAVSGFSTGPVAQQADPATNNSTTTTDDSAALANDSTATADDAAATRISENLSATTDLQELAGCDLVIEAVPEVLTIKKSVFAELEGVLAEDALLKLSTLVLAVAAAAALLSRLLLGRAPVAR